MSRHFDVQLADGTEVKRDCDGPYKVEKRGGWRGWDRVVLSCEACGATQTVGDELRDDPPGVVGNQPKEQQG